MSTRISLVNQKRWHMKWYETHIFYLNARRGTGPGGGKTRQDLRRTPRWKSWWKSSDLILWDPEDHLRNKNKSELLSLQKIFPDSALMCLLLRVVTYRVQRCSLNGHSGLSSVPVPWHCHEHDILYLLLAFHSEKIVCRPVLWALTASMIHAHLNFHFNLKLWASRDILFSDGTRDVCSLMLIISPVRLSNLSENPFFLQKRM